MTTTHTSAGIGERATVLADPLPEPRNLAANVVGFRSTFAVDWLGDVPVT